MGYEISGTAVPTHIYKRLGDTIIADPVCRCYTEPANAAGSIYCPAHGHMIKKLDGRVVPADKIMEVANNALQ